MSPDEACPDRIYLQVTDEDGILHPLDERTWSAESLHASEVEYVRADRIAPASVEAGPSRGLRPLAPEGIDLAKLRAAVEARSRDRTHSEGCYLWSDHRDCAIMALLRIIESAPSAHVAVCGPVSEDEAKAIGSMIGAATKMMADQSGAAAPLAPEGLDELRRLRAELERESPHSAVASVEALGQNPTPSQIAEAIANTRTALASGVCPGCDGLGCEPDECDGRTVERACRTCNGTGKVAAPPVVGDMEGPAG